MLASFRISNLQVYPLTFFLFLLVDSLDGDHDVMFGRNLPSGVWIFFFHAIRCEERRKGVIFEKKTAKKNGSSDEPP